MSARCIFHQYLSRVENTAHQGQLKIRWCFHSAFCLASQVLAGFKDETIHISQPTKKRRRAMKGYLPQHKQYDLLFYKNCIIHICPRFIFFLWVWFAYLKIYQLRDVCASFNVSTTISGVERSMLSWLVIPSSEAHTYWISSLECSYTLLSDHL